MTSMRFRHLQKTGMIMLVLSPSLMTKAIPSSKKDGFNNITAVQRDTLIPAYFYPLRWTNGSDEVVEHRVMPLRYHGHIRQAVTKHTRRGLIMVATSSLLSAIVEALSMEPLVKEMVKGEATSGNTNSPALVPFIGKDGLVVKLQEGFQDGGQLGPGAALVVDLSPGRKVGRFASSHTTPTEVQGDPWRDGSSSQREPNHKIRISANFHIKGRVMSEGGRHEPRPRGPQGLRAVGGRLHSRGKEQDPSPRGQGTTLLTPTVKWMSGVNPTLSQMDGCQTTFIKVL
ncbi:hypothetical protein J6590_038943, partial [Homalodisca vitripennis]